MTMNNDLAKERPLESLQTGGRRTAVNCRQRYKSCHWYDRTAKV